MILLMTHDPSGCRGEHFIGDLECIIAMYVIAVSHNRLDISDHAVVNNTRTLYRCF